MAKKPSAPELALTDEERTELLTAAVADKTTHTKGTATVLRREPHTAWIQYGALPPGVWSRMAGSTLGLVLHLTLIVISLGLWLVVLLLLALVPKDHHFRVDILTVTPSGAIETKSIQDPGKGRKLVRELTAA
ncbi:hypothetical protein [Kocuria tytonis]|uniref:Uncharacterized protein n=1 Tax=Kocuria tytonis TaxID=2054280 RepID=A0A495A867_9MICC|nr:hypothetical protein [Kocuria tytonis]RKQ36189.1 hypothetical protein C1C97_000440 [Kocuria tytonis]